MIRKRWIIRPADPNLVQQFVGQLKIAPAVAQILVARGIHTPEEAYRFLHPSKIQIHDPFLFRDMQKAVQRLEQALKIKEKVLVYGDYDVDGLTSTALLFGNMQKLGFNVEFFIPHRFNDGYGLQAKHLQRAKENGFSLIVTVDCGTREIEALKNAREAGLDIIVSDHHLPPDQLPPEQIVLNPQVPGCGYPDPHLSGVGVAFKLVQALTQHLGKDVSEIDSELDLVALGTVADVAPLVGENRILVREGMSKLQHPHRPGVQALSEVAQVIQEQLGVYQIAFQLAPRMNALGRLGDASGSVRFLLTDDPDEAMKIAKVMDEANRERQRLQEAVIRDIRKIAETEPDRFSAPLIVLADENWHRGVIGIVASKVLEWHDRPALLFSIEGDLAHGSARSRPGIPITQALEECQDLLDRFGGHECAAGVTLPKDRIPALKERLENIVGNWSEENPSFPELEIDAEVRLEDLSEDLIYQINELGPFGQSNPRPLFVSHGVSAGDTARIVGNGSLKLMMAQGNSMLDAIAFGQGYQLGQIDLSGLDVAYYPEINEWQGRRSIQLNVVEMRNQETPTPVASPEVVPAFPEGCRIRKLTGDNSKDCFHIFEKQVGNRKAVFAYDPNGSDEKFQTSKESVRIEVVDLNPQNWELSMAPEVVGMVPGRKGPELIRRFLTDLLSRFPKVDFYLVVPGSEIQEIHQTLKELYPERKHLLEIYQGLKEALKNQTFNLDKIEPIFKGKSRSHLASCLKVFEELDLIERKASADQMILKQVRVRRDILMSPTYRQGQALRSRWMDWIQVLQGTEAQLTQYLYQGIVP